MTRGPALAAIDAAELRLIESRRNVRKSLERTRSAVRSTIARPSTLVLVAVASGMSTFLFVHRPRPTAKSPIGADSNVRSARSGLLRTFVSLFGARLLTLAFQFGAAARK